jgi:hypothetical protein
MFELFVTANHYHVIHRKNTTTEYDFEKNIIIQYGHHIFLPSVLYFSIISFIFTYQQPSIYLLILAISVGLFYVLFKNIQSFYNHHLSLLKSTKHVYDFVSIAIVFLTTAAFIEVESAYSSLDTDFLVAGMLGMIVAVSVLTVARHTENQEAIPAGIIVVLIFLALYRIFVELDFAVLTSAFVLTYLYQSFIVFIESVIDRQSTKEEVIEYLIISLLAFTLVFLYAR